MARKRPTEMMICKLAIFLLLLLLGVSGTTNRSDPEPQCVLQVRVARNTVFKTPVMKLLKINCTVRYPGCHRIPRISWCKIYENDCITLNHSNYLTTEWKDTAQNEGMAFLIFLNISMKDAGLYRCKHGDWSVSHANNVTVTDDRTNFSQKQCNSSDQNQSENDLQWLWPYVYICSGTAGPVVLVILLYFVISCKDRKSSKKDPAKNQVNSDLLTTVVYRIRETKPVTGENLSASEEQNIPLYEMI